MARKTQRDTDNTLEGEKPRIIEDRPIMALDGIRTVQYLPVHELVRWDRNPKDHDIGAIHGSVRRFGFNSPLIVNEATGMLVAGHGRLDTLQQMFDHDEPPPEGIICRDDGEWLVPVLRGISFRNDTEAAAFAVADNRVTELGGWNDTVLYDVLRELHDKDALIVTGFDTDKLNELAEQLALTDQPEEEKEVDEKEVEGKHDALMEKWETAPGQVWLIPSSSLAGRKHRIKIGDSTNPDDWEELMDGIKGQLLLTSPPYGVGKEYEESGYEAWAQLMQDVFSLTGYYVPLAAVNLGDVKVGPDHRELHTYGDLVGIMDRCGYPLIGTRIWEKNPAWLNGQYWVSSFRGVDDYEYIGLFGHTEYKNRIDTEWRYRSRWNFGSVAKNDLHPAAFPMEMPTRLIQLLTDRNHLIVEPFFGSGTTMAAAEQLGRLCFGMERDPRYVAVALERMEQMGLKPRLETK